MTLKSVSLALLLTLASTPAAFANNAGGDVGVGANLGTTGGAVEAKLALSPRVMVRGAYNYLDVSVDLESDDIDYEGDLSLSNVGAFVDLAPFANAFVLSGGAYLGPKKVDLLATPTSSIEIDGQIFTVEEAGRVSGLAEFAAVAPYAGIGFDNFATSRGNWSFNARAGVMFTGSADVSLASEGGEFSADPRLLERLRAEETALEDDAEDYKYYPVLTLGLARRF